MKYILCFLTGLLLLQKAAAQKPETVYGHARVNMPVSWYKEQETAWKKVIDKNPKDANAWYNYLNAVRVICFNDTTPEKMHGERFQHMQKVVEDMGKHVPNTYEYNLGKWMSGGFDMSLLPYLKKAAELGEGRTEHIDYMINWGEMDRDMAKRDLYSKKKYESGDVSTGMLYYNYNVMMGLEPNAILITAGDNDTYPVWILQAQGIRKDITVINLSLLHIDEYRNRLFKQLEVSKWEMYNGNDLDSMKASENRFKDDIIKHIAGNSRNYPLYIALSATDCDASVKLIEDNLYLTGLAYKYSKQPLDNIAIMKRNFEKQYALDYIDKPFYQDISSGLVKQINRNYEVPMLKLYDHYKMAGDMQKQEWIKAKLISVSKGTDEEKEVNKHLDLN